MEFSTRMDKFALDCIKNTIENEGGYKIHYDPDDSGGITLAGISSIHWPDWCDWEEIGDEVKSGFDLSLINDFYMVNFWRRFVEGLLPDETEMAFGRYYKKTVEFAFDFSVNCGGRTAIKALQKTINSFEFPIAVDGIAGPKTKVALQEILYEEDDQGYLFHLYLMSRLSHYEDICKKNAKNFKFIKGWFKRTMSYM